MKIRCWILLPAISLTLFGCFLAIRVGQADSSSDAYNLHCGLIVTLAVALALWFQVEPKPEDAPSISTEKISLRAWGGLVILAAAVACFSGVVGMKQFAGFDHSALIDTPWRILNGQRPYLDFPSTLPVGFYLSAYYAFKLGGVAWSSLVGINSLFAGLTFLWMAWLLARLFGVRPKTWLLAFCIQACTTMLAGYWWYNPVTTVMGAVFFLSSVVWVKNPDSRRVLISWGGALLLLAACKPNIAGPLIAGATLILLFDPVLRRRVILAAACAFIVFVALLALHRIALTDMLAGYLSVASRGLSSHQFLQDLDPGEKVLSLVFLGLIVAPLALLIPRGFRLSRVQCLCLVALVCGLYGFATNGESKLVDIPLVLLAAMIWTKEAGNPVRSTAVSEKLLPSVVVVQSTLVMALAFSGIGLGWLRHRVKLAGQGTFFEYSRISPIPDVPFFAGLKAGPVFQSTVAEVSAAIQQHPGASVFFGPRMQWAYAAMNRPAPIDQPSWWHPGVAYRAEDDSRYLENWRNARHDVLIFIKNDYTYLSVEFRREIAIRYDRENHAGITIYLLKKEVIGNNHRL
ncbi:MAG TPA: hypothetical protein VK985_06665 [Rariglobus sp.]|nr:hypothetical protein [Rariglobus sp.]